MFIAYVISHYLFPGHSNNQKAKLLHPTSVFFLILNLIVYQVILQLLPISGVKILGYAANIPINEVVSITNQKREENGLARLEINPLLTQAAKAKGEDMLADNYWAHVAPDGTDPWTFFVNVGYKYRYAGENLARDFSNPQTAVEAWLASPSHRENLLSSKYDEIGIAVVEGELDGVDTTIIVQFFGTRYVDTTPQLPIAKADIVAEVLEIATTPTSASQPTPEPTKAETVPKPTEMIVVPVASSQDTQPPSPQILISPFSITRNVSLITVFSLFLIMVIDGVVTYKRKVARIGGRVFAHLAFLGMILAIALIARVGKVL